MHRLAQVSVNIIDQCVAQGVPFAREYGGLLDNRSFGGAQVSRTFYARGQTGQQLLLGAYQSMMRQVEAGTVKMFPRHEMLDLVVVDGRARGIIARNLVTGAIERFAGGRGAARHRRLRQRLFPVDQRRELQRHRDLARVQARRAVRQPVLHADSPDVHPGVRRAPVEAHADEREPAQRRPRLGAEGDRATSGRRRRSPKTSATTTSSAAIPRSATSCRATWRRAPPRRCATRAAASARRGLAVYLDFAESIGRLGEDTIRERYGNLFQMYEKITDEKPVQDADADLPRHPLHDGRALGRLQPDVHHPGPVRARRGELLGSRRQPPGRQRADAGPGRRVLRRARPRCRTTSAGTALPKVTTDHDAFGEAEAGVRSKIDRLLAVKGRKTPREIHRDARQADVGQRRHGPHRGGPQGRPARRSPACARSSGRTCRCRVPAPR